ncbi:MAG: hypothetical protein RIB84_06920 [Sneathiellaceae bacterium]
MAELSRFNVEMRKIYGEGRAALAAESRPVILLAGDEVTLITARGRDTQGYIPPIYHKLKAVSHVVLGLTGAMAPVLEGGVPGDGWQADLQRIDAAIATLLPQIGKLGLTPAQEERSRRVLTESQAFIAGALKEGQPDRQAFTALMARIKPLWLTDVMEAAQAQLGRLDEIVDGWRARLAPAEWATLHVLVTGPRNPRPGNLQVQYFLRALNEPEPGNRVIYTENIFAPEQAMDLFGVVVMDRAVSMLVFGDRFRMEEDLLAYAAGNVLDGLMSGEAPPAGK